jgi:hypothetical protein
MPVAAVTSLPTSGAERAADARAQEPTAFAEVLKNARRASEVQPAHTPLSGEEAASALSDAWHGVMGRAPTAKQLSLLTAQWSLETGGGRAMMNYNFGGTKGRSPEGLTVAYKTKEGYGATERTITDHFRAYSSARAGAEDYVRMLKARFPRAMEAVKTGDATAFAHALKNEGYYTGSEADYTKAVASLSDRALDKGFSAIGQTNGHATVDVSTPSEELSLRAIDALELADQMSRAAMRIAAGSSRDDDAWLRRGT